MIFGILKDIKEEEFRVICTPMEVHSIRAAGHEVWAQHDCGKLAGFSDMWELKTVWVVGDKFETKV